MYSGESKAKDWLAERIGFELGVAFRHFAVFGSESEKFHK